MKIASWNVNGIRACAKKGLLDWLEDRQPDVLCLQEIKANRDQLDDALLAPPGYVSHFFSAEKKGYSGTAFYVKTNLSAEIEHGIGVQKYDREGRTITLHHDQFILLNGYYPNGQRDHGRVDYKLKFSKKMLNKALKLKQETGKTVLLTGDFNTAHHEIDLRNPKSNRKTTGFLPEERAFLDLMIKRGFVDTFRECHPDEPDHYTWWTYRGDCRERNVGWRLDYFFVDKQSLPLVTNVSHDTDVLGSDHCPVLIDIDL